jgi:hypothetical protein
MEPPEDPGMVAANFEVQVPPELEGGAYANFLNVWHSPYEFTFDFAVTQPPIPQNPQDPAAPVTVPCRVVARVKVPPALVFDIMRAINQNLARYEQMFGEIPRPEPPQEEAE